MPGPGINDPVAMVTGTGPYTHTFYHTDHHGSVAVTARDNGNPMNGPFLYDPHGNCTISSSGAACTTLAATVQPFFFTGMYLDKETGLFFDRDRFYSSILGRFLQTDAVGYQDDLNLYTYVGNDPINLTDPTGLILEINNGVSSDCGTADDCHTSGGYIRNRAGSKPSGNVQLAGGDFDPMEGETGPAPEPLEREPFGMGHNNPPDAIDDPEISAPVEPDFKTGEALRIPEPTKTDVIINDHMTRRDLDAARRELRGEIVAIKPNGEPYNHIHEVQDAQRGLINRIGQIQRQLASPTITWDAKIKLLNEMSKASEHLDYSEQFVPR